MDYTQNLNLPQFAESDRIHHDDFNDAMEKLDAAVAACGNCKIVTGSYVGTGSYGVNNKNTLIFDARPNFVVIGGEYTIFALRPMADGATLRSSGLNQTYGAKLSWSGNSISWYAESFAALQCNSADVTYHYMALLN